jgi:hypothetical protein
MAVDLKYHAVYQIASRRKLLVVALSTRLRKNAFQVYFSARGKPYASTTRFMYSGIFG